MRRIVALCLVAVVLGSLVGPEAAMARRFRFTHGVAAGDVNGDGVLLWTRTNQEARVRAQVATDRRFRDIVASRSRIARESRGFTVEVPITGLLASDEYFYRFAGPGGVTSPVGRFRTPPEGGDVTFGYSGDSDGTRTDEGVDNFRDEIAQVATAARQSGPDFFVYFGDTIYSDSGLADAPAMTLAQYRSRYREVRSIPEIRSLLASTSVVTQWDDHEVVNDYAPQPYGPIPPFPPDLTADRVTAGQTAFRQSFPVREGAAGETYRSFHWGQDVEVFVLDERSYRQSPLGVFIACDQNADPDVIEPDLAPTLPQAWRNSFVGIADYFAGPPPPDCLPAVRDPGRTLLGADQKQWLKDGLAASQAMFKIIVNEVPMQQFYALPYDRWEGFEAERLEVLSYIDQNDINGVFFVTTDTHATIGNPTCDVTLDETTGDYVCDRGKWPLELISGPLGTNTYAAEVDQVAPGASGQVSLFIDQILQSSCVNLDQPSFGLVEIDTAAGTLTATSKRFSEGGPVSICAVQMSA